MLRTLIVSFISFLSVYTDGWKVINPPKFAKSLDFYTKIGYL